MKEKKIVARGFQDGNDALHDTESPTNGAVKPKSKRSRKSLADNGQILLDTLGNGAESVKKLNGGGDLASIDALAKDVAPPLNLKDLDLSTGIVKEIALLWPKRQIWHRAEKSLMLSSYALCRRLTRNANPELPLPKLKKEATVLYKAMLSKKDEHPLKELAMMACLSFLKGRDAIKTERTLLENRLVELVQQTPIRIANFVENVRGFGHLSLASLIGEAPGTNFRWFLDFETVSRVWKRYGMAVMPDGTRQRRVAGEAAIEHGFVPRRRSVVWAIGDTMIKAHGSYYALYLKFKEKEVAKNPEERPIIVHARAKRLMEKRFLRDLWNVAHGRNVNPPHGEISNPVTVMAMEEPENESLDTFADDLGGEEANIV